MLDACRIGHASGGVCDHFSIFCLMWSEHIGHLVTLCLLLLTCTHSYAAFIHYRSRNTFPGTEDRLLNESAQHNFLSGKALFPIVVGVGFGYGGLWCLVPTIVSEQFGMRDFGKNFGMYVTTK